MKRGLLAGLAMMLLLPSISLANDWGYGSYGYYYPYGYYPYRYSRYHYYPRPYYYYYRYREPYYFYYRPYWYGRGYWR